jgi:hypothetical protein
MKQPSWFDERDALPRVPTFAETQAAQQRGVLVCDHEGQVKWVQNAHLCSFYDLTPVQRRKHARSRANRGWKAWHDKCIKTERLKKGETTCMRTYAPPDGTVSFVYHVGMCERVPKVVVDVVTDGKVPLFASTAPIPDVFSLEDIPAEFVECVAREQAKERVRSCGRSMDTKDVHKGYAQGIRTRDVRDN